MPTIPPITLEKATEVAEFAMILQRQTYKFDATMYDRGVYNAKTTQAKYKYDLITEAIEFFKSLVSPAVPGQDPTDTNQCHSEAS